ncbi:putative phosphoglucomutase [Arthrobacter globiformis NBRC 12137]|uniref:Putative phosphoglucomutase n=1 Tax=Arthrobacter globiformis (strain ATCC 8010 / DSM 20124 / JCM 1332 / NBRC 12137 / NCIMB 8907 / NRRL B-2979 / 168) TaxID=1077972 RepID=H0QMG5_ARTG1|nr:phospho-sugar mutase [Arthrobacter globiformis]GAB14016.1 putative phosphoglucomutase [Arthrobacter globiformis NBRC 12137]
MTSSEADLQLLNDARAWAAQDPDPRTAATLIELVKLTEAGTAAARQDLEDSFRGTLQFGTAGLRAALGPGPNRMNRVVVRRAAAGFANFLVRAVAEAAPGTRPRAVVGYDARYNSEIFAAETAAVLTAAGIETFLMPAALPTPLLAYAVRALECDGGVMVTASHNPPQDNGYKVYLGRHAVEENGRGAQIVAPYDALIATEISNVGDLASIPLAQDGWTVLDAGIVQDYEAATAGLADRGLFPARDLKIVLTPLHGVGGTTAVAVLRAAGFTDVTLVSEQAEPDPDFPTVSFPNPEEPGALDLALGAAMQADADIVLANDPDADRAAVAAKDPDTGAWRMLRGDEVGALLGAHVVARLAAGADGSEADAGGGVFASSIVSSRLLARIAAAAGYAHEETLTGFKWISRVPGLAYGYEEALGYCVAPDLVRDKDGLSAAVLIAELAAAAKSEGKTIFDTLDELYLVHGLHASDQLNIRVGDLGLLDAMMNRLRVNPPESFGGSAVASFVDLAEGSEQLPPTDGLLYVTRDLSRVIIRPSGTEPKLKCYLEVIQSVGSAAELPEARLAARAALDQVLTDVREALGL